MKKSKNISANKENLLIILGALFVMFASLKISHFNIFPAHMPHFRQIKIANLDTRAKQETKVLPTIAPQDSKTLTLKNGNVLSIENKTQNSKKDTIKIYNPTNSAQEKTRNVPFKLNNPEQLANGKVKFECTKFMGYGVYNPKNNTFKIYKTIKEERET